MCTTCLRGASGLRAPEVQIWQGASIDTPPFFQVDSTERPCKGDPNKFVHYDDKIFCGLDVSLSKGIADELGVDVHFIRSAHTFNETVDLVFENKADIAISKISRTLSRTKKVSFSKPYLTMKQSLLLNRVQFAEQSSGKRPEIAIRELTGNVGVIQDSSYVGYTTQKFPKTIVNEQPSWPDDLLCPPMAPYTRMPIHLHSSIHRLARPGATTNVIV